MGVGEVETREVEGEWEEKAIAEEDWVSYYGIMFGNFCVEAQASAGEWVGGEWGPYDVLDGGSQAEQPTQLIC